MGYDCMEVSDFIEDKVMPELNIELICDYLKDPRYKNPLKTRI